MMREDEGQKQEGAEAENKAQSQGRPLAEITL
jgi:hypothetical protein